METNFFVIGENPRTAFFLRNIKFFLLSLIVIILGLSATVAYLYYKNYCTISLFYLKKHFYIYLIFKNITVDSFMYNNAKVFYDTALHTSAQTGKQSDDKRHYIRKITSKKF